MININKYTCFNSETFQKSYVLFLEFIYFVRSEVRGCFQLVAFVIYHIWQKALLMG